MTTKTISGTYSAGYLLSSAFNSVSITSSGSVGGFGLVTNALATVRNDGHLQATNGGNGLTLGSGGGAVDNYAGAMIRGGQAIAQSHRGVTGYAGGAGADLSVYATANNYGSIVGGGGGIGGTLSGAGGVGGAGASAHAGGYVNNEFRGVIEGGAGGTGGAANAQYPQFAGAGGAGGAGVALAASGYVYDGAVILGGAGGHGGYGIGASGAGGTGGAGITFAQGGRLSVATGKYGGAVVGGTGGVGGVSEGHYSAYAGNGGAGGAGFATSGLVALTNQALIQGGVGGAGGSGMAPGRAGDGGAGGVGAALAGGGEIINYGVIQGGAGGVAGAGPGGFGGSGGDGVDLAAGGTIHNPGTIRGGNASGGAAYGGVGISIAGVGLITNGSAAYKAATIAGGTYVGGGAYGVATAAGSQVTLVNYGTISSATYSVDFRSSLDTLVVEAGSTFIGKVVGGYGTLDLASGTGTVGFSPGGYDVTVSGSMPTTTFYYFDTLELAKGTNFSIAGAADVRASPSHTVIADGTLTVGSTLSVEGVLQVGGKLGGTKATVLSLDGGLATFEKKSKLTVGHVDLSSGTIAVDGTLTYAGKWDQTGGVLTLPRAAYLTLTGINQSFSGLMTETGGGTADVVFGPTSASVDALNSLTINELRLNAANTTFTVGAGGVTITNTAGLAFDDTLSGITGTTASSVLTVAGGLFGEGQIGEGKLGLVNNGGIQSQDLATPFGALTINTGAGEDINAGFLMSDSTGGLTVVSTLTNNGQVIATAGTLTLQGAVTGSGSGQVSGGTLFAASSFNQAVSFTTNAGTLELAQSQAFTATVTGFSASGGTFFDLNDIAFVSAGEASFGGTSTGGLLTVTDGTHTAKIAMSGDYLTCRFTCASDGHGGALIHAFLPAEAPPATASPRALAAAMASLQLGAMTATEASRAHPLASSQALFSPHATFA